MNSQIIVDIIRKRVGAENAITQYQIADEYHARTGEYIDPRTVRVVIEAIRFEEEPILSSTDPGGYFYPATRREYFDWKAREMAKAKKQMAKIEPVGIGVYRLFHRNVIQQAFDFVLGKVS